MEGRRKEERGREGGGGHADGQWGRNSGGEREREREREREWVDRRVRHSPRTD